MKTLKRYVCNFFTPPFLTTLNRIFEDYAKKMRDAAQTLPETRKVESLWPIIRICHARSRYVYESYFKHEAIPENSMISRWRNVVCWCKVCFQILVPIPAPDLVLTVYYNSLLAKCKNTGYEQLCFLHCIQTRVRRSLSNLLSPIRRILSFLGLPRMQFRFISSGLSICVWSGFSKSIHYEQQLHSYVPIGIISASVGELLNVPMFACYFFVELAVIGTSP